jgi:4-amino-4-deoxy-L-arabinose transferase-like glycosyltransferase
MRSRWLAAYIAVAVVALVRVAATHRVFSAVIDEPVHIVAGQEWWLGEVAFDPSHPPLEKFLSAIPYRHRDRIDVPDRLSRGLFLLYGGSDDMRDLAHARRANLIFLAIAVIVVIVWARRFGDGVALLAAAMLASMPPILGHAGLATTDMSIAGTLPLALLAFDHFLRKPTWTSSVLLGMAVGLGALSKFSFVLFFPICVVALLLGGRRPPGQPAPSTSLRAGSGRRYVVAALVALFVIWAGYRFTFDTLSSIHSIAIPSNWFMSHVPLPAPAFWDGALIVNAYNAQGRDAFLFGQISNHGFWYYFPVVFFFKTPLPFLLLALCGAFAIIRKRDGLEFVLMPLAIMLAVLPSSINIGLRHILPIYPPLCVVAAIGVRSLWTAAAKPPLSRAAAILLCAWLFIGVASSHPDYLAWFNEAAGTHPEQIAVDSNLDWGQDMLRLARLSRTRHIDTVAMHCVSAIPFSRHGSNGIALEPFHPATGWLALSETVLALDPRARAGGYDWLKGKPWERVGKSIRLYHVE